MPIVRRDVRVRLKREGEGTCFFAKEMFGHERLADGETDG